MWMANRGQPDRLEEPAAELGEVTLAGSSAGVALAGERRETVLCAPGGYHWTPKNGDTVLVVKSGAEGNPCVAGRVQEDDPAPGEVWISAASGAGIRLRPDGTILCTGNLRVTGTLTVEGTVRMGETVAMTGNVTANGFALGQPEGV